MNRRLILVGGGEHARVVADAARSVSGEFEIVGYVDRARRNGIAGVRDLGQDDDLARFSDCLAVLGIGGVEVSDLRESTVTRLDPTVSGWATIIHAGAWVSPEAEVATGAVIMAGAVVQSGARIGNHSVVNSGAVVEHDVVVGNYAMLSPGVCIGGGVEIGRNAIVGLGALVRDHVVIGARAMVAMGAVVVDSVPPDTTVAGLPAKKWT